MPSAPPSTKTLTATEIASMLGGELCGASDAKFGQVQDIKTAQANEVAFFKSTPNEMGQHPSEEDFVAMRDSAAGLLLVDVNCPSPPQCHIQVDNPSLAATIMAQFWQSRRAHCKPGIHPTAVIEDGAQVAGSAQEFGGAWVLINDETRVFYFKGDAPQANIVALQQPVPPSPTT